MDSLSQLLRNLGPVRIGALAAILLGGLGFFIYIIGGTARGEMGLLYAGLDPAEGGQIINRLEALSVPVMVKENGAQIYVPKEEVGRLRMVLAEGGLPSGGSMGYEIFDRTDTFSATSFTQDITHLRALEGEISRSIRTLANVASARVHLVLPKRELFSRTTQESSASILLKMAGPIRLSHSEVEAIRHLVASAVAGLSPDKISIVDNKGTLLARGNDKSQTGVTPSTYDEMRGAYEERLARMVESLVEKSIGAGKVRAEVSAEMDFDHYTENSEVYNPEGQVVRSTQNATEGATSSEANQQSITIENNLPKAPGAEDNHSKNNSNRSEETVNYEISKTITTHIKEIGAIKRLSIAVLVDGTYVTTEGKNTYTPRTPEALSQLTKLVQSAIGYRKDRGDVVEVLNLPFADTDSTVVSEKPTFMNLEKSDILRLVEIAAMIMVALLVMFVIVKPLMIRLLEVSQGQAASAILAQQAMSSPESVNQAADSFGKGGDNALDKKFNLGRIEGMVQSSSLTKVGDIIEKYPDETVTLLRNWMAESGSERSKE